MTTPPKDLKDYWDHRLAGDGLPEIEDRHGRLLEPSNEPEKRSKRAVAAQADLEAAIARGFVLPEPLKPVARLQAEYLKPRDIANHLGITERTYRRRAKRIRALVAAHRAEVSVSTLGKVGSDPAMQRKIDILTLFAEQQEKNRNG